MVPLIRDSTALFLSTLDNLLLKRYWEPALEVVPKTSYSEENLSLYLIL